MKSILIHSRKGQRDHCYWPRKRSGLCSPKVTTFHKGSHWRSRRKNRWKRSAAKSRIRYGNCNFSATYYLFLLKLHALAQVNLSVGNPTMESCTISLQKGKLNWTHTSDRRVNIEGIYRLRRSSYCWPQKSNNANCNSVTNTRAQ